MKKSKHRKKDKQRVAWNRKVPRGPFFVKHPLSDVPQEKLIPGLIELGKASKVRSHDCLYKTLSVLESAEPLQIIATLAVYGLFAWMPGQKPSPA